MLSRAGMAWAMALAAAMSATACRGANHRRRARFFGGGRTGMNGGEAGEEAARVRSQGVAGLVFGWGLAPAQGMRKPDSFLEKGWNQPCRHSRGEPRHEPVWRARHAGESPNGRAAFR